MPFAATPVPALHARAPLQWHATLQRPLAPAVTPTPAAPTRRHARMTWSQPQMQELPTANPVRQPAPGDYELGTTRLALHENGTSTLRIGETDKPLPKARASVLGVLLANPGKVVPWAVEEPREAEAVRKHCYALRSLGLPIYTGPQGMALVPDPSAGPAGASVTFVPHHASPGDRARDAASERWCQYPVAQPVLQLAPGTHGDARLQLDMGADGQVAVVLEGRPARIQGSAARVLALLLANRGRVVPPEAFARLLGMKLNTVRALVSALRKLEPQLALHIVSVSLTGWVLVADDGRRAACAARQTPAAVPPSTRGKRGRQALEEMQGEGAT